MTTVCRSTAARPWVGDQRHGQPVRWYLACGRARRRIGRLRARSFRLLRPTQEPCRLVRHVRTHRLLLDRRQPALRGRPLPLTHSHFPHRVPLLASPAVHAFLALPHAALNRSPANRVDCNGFSYRAQDAGSMISTPFWPETTRTRCVARRGAISRNCAGDSSGRCLRSPFIVSSLQGGKYAIQPKGRVVFACADAWFGELRIRLRRNAGHRRRAMRLRQRELLRRLRARLRL